MENGTVGGRTPAKNATEIIPPQNIVAQGIGHGFALTILAVFLGQPLFNDLIALDDIIKGIYLPALERCSSFWADIIALTDQLMVDKGLCCSIDQIGFGGFVEFVGNAALCNIFRRNG